MADKKKKAKWTYTGKILSVLFPDGKTGSFDLDLVPVTSHDHLMMYGAKQWMASNSADCKSTPDKLASFQSDYDGLITHGLEFRGEGQIGIIGSTRSNAVARDMVKVKKSDLDATTFTLVELRAYAKLPGLMTPEMTEKLAELEAAAVVAAKSKTK